LINIFTKNVIQNYSKGRTDNKPENIPSQPSANKDGNELSPVNDINLMDPNDHDATLLKPPGSINHFTATKLFIFFKPKELI